MKKLVLLALLLPLVACQKKEEEPTAAGMASPEMQASVLHEPQAPAEKSTAMGKYMAYEHELMVRTGRDGIQPLYDTLLAACQKTYSDSCVLLESSLSRGERGQARLRMRATRSAVQGIASLAGASGTVLHSSTNGEDLSFTMADAQKRLQMLTSYRERLEKLQESSANVETLMKIASELSNVQSEIESKQGEIAGIGHRTRTQVLAITIGSESTLEPASPLHHAIRDFGNTLVKSAAAFISVTAALLPWAVIAALALWVLRLVRRRKSS